MVIHGLGLEFIKEKKESKQEINHAFDHFDQEEKNSVKKTRTRPRKRTQKKRKHALTKNASTKKRNLSRKNDIVQESNQETTL